MEDRIEIIKWTTEFEVALHRIEDNRFTDNVIKGVGFANPALTEESIDNDIINLSFELLSENNQPSGTFLVIITYREDGICQRVFKPIIFNYITDENEDGDIINIDQIDTINFTFTNKPKDDKTTTY